jgi:hypothetical protein
LRCSLIKNLRAVAYDPTGEMPDDGACSGELSDCVDAASVRFPPGEPGLVRTYAGMRHWSGHLCLVGVDLGLVRGKSAESPQDVDKRRVMTVTDERHNRRSERVWSAKALVRETRE